MKRFGIYVAMLSLSLIGVTSVGLAQVIEPSSAIKIPAGANSLPPNAEPGKCYARVWEDPKYGTVLEKVVRREASERIEIIPAKYESVEEKVLVRAAYDKDEAIAPIYETVTEKILVKPASTRWKKGSGLVEKVDNFTGEIMCLEEVPAQYKTITKQVLRVPATTKLAHVPAEYKVVKVEKLVSLAQEKRIPIPAQYETVTKTVLESDGRMAWKSVLCETNAPPNIQTKEREVKAIHAQSRAASSASGKAPRAAAANPWIFWGLK